jgi:hypothetical protein
MLHSILPPAHFYVEVFQRFREIPYMVLFITAASTPALLLFPISFSATKIFIIDLNPQKIKLFFNYYSEHYILSISWRRLWSLRATEGSDEGIAAGRKLSNQ